MSTARAVALSDSPGCAGCVSFATSRDHGTVGGEIAQPLSDSAVSAEGSLSVGFPGTDDCGECCSSSDSDDGTNGGLSFPTARNTGGGEDWVCTAGGLALGDSPESAGCVSFATVRDIGTVGDEQPVLGCEGKAVEPPDDFAISAEGSLSAGIPGSDDCCECCSSCDSDGSTN